MDMHNYKKKYTIDTEYPLAGPNMWIRFQSQMS